jgi:hypothetical protein
MIPLSGIVRCSGLTLAQNSSLDDESKCMAQKKRWTEMKHRVCSSTRRIPPGVGNISLHAYVWSGNGSMLLQALKPSRQDLSPLNFIDDDF